MPLLYICSLFTPDKKGKRYFRCVWFTCVCSPAGSHRQRCAEFGWLSGPLSESYRSGTPLLSQPHPEGGASGRNETPSSMDEAAEGHVPAPLHRDAKSCQMNWQRSVIRLKDSDFFNSPHIGINFYFYTTLGFATLFIFCALQFNYVILYLLLSGNINHYCQYEATSSHFNSLRNS